MKRITLFLFILIAVFSGCETSIQGNDKPQQWRGNEAQLLSDEQVKQEMESKIERVRGFLNDQELRGILIRQYRNYAWLTAGVGNNRIEYDKSLGAVTLLILDDGSRYVIANGSEAPRVMDENLGRCGFQLLRHEWFYGDSLQDVIDRQILEVAGEGSLGADHDSPGAINVAEDFAALRLVLTESELAKYRWLGEQLALAVEDVCREVEPGMSEYQIEALTAQRLWARGLVPTVILVGVDERIRSYRHALATDAELKKYVMVNVCAEKWGLVAAATRFAHFGPLSESLTNRLRSVSEINARFEANSTPGKRFGQFFEEMQAWYAEQGFPREWQQHHQGGAIGYDNREIPLLPGSRVRIQKNMAFAWNPTITGVKVEDTILVTGNGVEIVTTSPSWPTLDVTINGVVYPQPMILIR